MCTLIALDRCVQGMPLVVAANRDEFYDRPAEGPALRDTSHGAVVAPLDVRGGGTWLGLNRFGVFAALTNRPCEAPDPTCRSRGLLVLDALEAKSAKEAAERVAAAVDASAGNGPFGGRNDRELRANRETVATKGDLEAYNPFNFFAADGRDSHAVTHGDPAGPAGPESFFTSLSPGVHVIGNVGLHESSPKLQRLAGEVATAAGGASATVLDRLAAVCRGHTDPSDAFAAACIHSGGYGTRSSLLMSIGEEGLSDDRSALYYANGAPCTTEYQEFTPLFQELGRGSQLAEGEPTVRNVS